jgi:hypothetical protein
VVTFVVAACSSSSGGGPPSLYQDWLYTDSSGNSGIAATFKSDGTYVVSDLMITSSTSANAQVETGTFTASNGSLAMAPKEDSCPGPDAAYSLGYSFQGGNLEIVQPSGVLLMQPNTTSPGSIGSFAITIGCFDGSGNLKASPLAAVSN